jgi:hypothetical protein
METERAYFSQVPPPLTEQRWEPMEYVVNDAWDEPDAGKPPCDFCRREVPCECSTLAARIAGDETCMCTCGRCQAPGLPDFVVWP